MAKRTLQKKTEMEERRESLMCLCLKMESGQSQESSTMTWEDGALLGEYMTHNIGESPNVAVVSRLSAILEECPHQKYYLSPKATLGILRRAQKRGKSLPEPLFKALLAQSGLSKETTYGETEITNSGKILRVLWEEIGEETFIKWVQRTYVLVSKKTLLLSSLCRKSSDGSNDGYTCPNCETEQGTCPHKDTSCSLWYLWESWVHRGTSQRQEPDEQLIRELNSFMQKLSCSPTPETFFVCCLREACKGSSSMSEALASIEEEFTERLGYRVHVDDKTATECITEPDKVWDARGNGNGNLCSTLTGDHDNRITDYTNVVVQKEEIYSVNGDSHESGVSVMSEVSHALKTTTKESVFVEQGSDDVSSGQSYPCICIGNGQAHVTEHYTEEVSQTLNCMHDPMTILEPFAYQLVGVNSNSMKSSNPNSGCYETEQAGTITTNGCVPNNPGGTAIMEPVNASKVCCICSYSSNCMKSSNPHSGVYEAETSRTLDTVSCGNPVCCQGGMAVVEPVIPFEGNGCRDSHKGDGWSTEQVSYTLNTVERHGVAYGEIESSSEFHPVLVDRAAFNQGKNAQFDIKIEETETVPSLVARGPHAVAQPVQYHVRRLTPLECTRLQGYPDGWVDIGDWIDSKGKKHKEADAPKYKALGNSIALPFWKWLCHNIVNRLKKDGQTTTMASLFDGIGGFPLCWIESTQEKSDVLWISEIEEFPIAVTRHHFS